MYKVLETPEPARRELPQQNEGAVCHVTLPVATSHAVGLKGPPASNTEGVFQISKPVVMFRAKSPDAPDVPGTLSPGTGKGP